MSIQNKIDEITNEFNKKFSPDTYESAIDDLDDEDLYIYSCWQNTPRTPDLSMYDQIGSKLVLTIILDDPEHF